LKDEKFFEILDKVLKAYHAEILEPHLALVKKNNAKAKAAGSETTGTETEAEDKAEANLNKLDSFTTPPKSGNAEEMKEKEKEKEGVDVMERWGEGLVVAVFAFITRLRLIPFAADFEGYQKVVSLFVFCALCYFVVCDMRLTFTLHFSELFFFFFR
jgi:hypothetical protein